MVWDKIQKQLETYPEDSRLEILQKISRESYTHDLYATCKHLLGYNEIDWSVHCEAITGLESIERRKLICLPRGSFKSSIASICYAIWRLIRDPNERILIDSELYSNSVTYLRSIKQHIESEKFRAQIGIWKTEESLWQEGQITIAARTNKALKEASITCGGVGTTKVGQHYTLIIGDDYNSRDNSSTPDKCKKVIEHFRYNLNILEPGGEYVVIGTRYAELDLIGFILNDVLGLKHLAEGKLKVGLL